MKNNTKTPSSPTIGEIIDALETIIATSKLVGAQRFSTIITDKLYSDHDETYIEMLELAGERAKTIQQDIWQKKNAHRITTCGPELSRK